MDTREESLRDALEILINEIRQLEAVQQENNPAKQIQSLNNIIKSIDSSDSIKALPPSRVSLDSEEINDELQVRKMWRDQHPRTQSLQISDQALEVQIKSNRIREYLESHIYSISSRLNIKVDLSVKAQPEIKPPEASQQQQIKPKKSAAELDLIQKKNILIKELRDAEENKKWNEKDLKNNNPKDIEKFLKGQVKLYSDKMNRISKEISRIEKEINKASNPEQRSRKALISQYFSKPVSFFKSTLKSQNKTRMSENTHTTPRPGKK